MSLRIGLLLSVTLSSLFAAASVASADPPDPCDKRELFIVGDVDEIHVCISLAHVTSLTFDDGIITTGRPKFESLEWGLLGNTITLHPVRLPERDNFAASFSVQTHHSRLSVVLHPIPDATRAHRAVRVRHWSIVEKERRVIHCAGSRFNSSAIPDARISGALSTTPPGKSAGNCDCDHLRICSAGLPSSSFAAGWVHRI